MVLVSMRVCTRIIGGRLHGFRRVAFVHYHWAPFLRKLWIQSHVGVEQIVDSALVGHVVGFKEGVCEGFSRGLAASARDVGALDGGDLGIGHVAYFVGQGFDFVERLEVWLGFAGGAGVDETPP